MKPDAEILRILRSLRWRMVLGDLLRSMARAALFFFGVLVVFTAVAWWDGGFRPNPADIPIVLTWPFVFGAIAALVITALRFPWLERVARLLDAAGATQDRFVTGLRLAEKAGANELETVALAEIAGWMRLQKPGLLLPVRVPRELPWIAVPVAMLALLWWDAMNAAAIRDARAAQEHAVRLVLSTYPDNPDTPPLAKEFVRCGASPRGAQALILAGNIFALPDGHCPVAKADIAQAAHAALRHRIIFNFWGGAGGRTGDGAIAEILRANPA